MASEAVELRIVLTEEGATATPVAPAAAAPATSQATARPPQATNPITPPAPTAQPIKATAPQQAAVPPVSPATPVKATAPQQTTASTIRPNALLDAAWAALPLAAPAKATAPPSTDLRPNALLDEAFGIRRPTPTGPTAKAAAPTVSGTAPQTAGTSATIAQASVQIGTATVSQAAIKAANVAVTGPSSPVAGQQQQIWNSQTAPPPVRQPTAQPIGAPANQPPANAGNILQTIQGILSNPVGSLSNMLGGLGTAATGFGIALTAATVGFKAWTFTVNFANEQMKTRANIEAKQSRGDVIGAAIDDLNRRRLTDYIPILGQIDALRRQTAAAGLQAFQARGEGIEKRTREIAQYDPRLAQAVAMADVRKTMTDIQEARLTGESRARFIDADARLKQMTQMAPLAEEIRKANHEADIRERLVGSKNVDQLRQNIQGIDRAELDEGLKGFLDVFKDPKDIQRDQGAGMAKRYADIMEQALQNAKGPATGKGIQALDRIWDALDPHKHPLIFGQHANQPQNQQMGLPPAFNIGVP